MDFTQILDYIHNVEARINYSDKFKLSSRLTSKKYLLPINAFMMAEKI